jgi:hypothetical protein
LQSERTALNKRWSELFEQLLNNSSLLDPNIIKEIPEKTLHLKLDELPIENEVERVIKELQCSKAADHDGIPPDVFRTGGQLLVKNLTKFLCVCWKDGCLPPRFERR